MKLVPAHPYFLGTCGIAPVATKQYALADGTIDAFQSSTDHGK